MTDHLRVLSQTLRTRHWVKNLLVFVPLVTSHQILNPTLLWIDTLAFASFCLAASAGYIVNDLRDLDADRLHSEKRFRPIVAGELSASYARILVAMLWMLSFVIALGGVSRSFATALAIYIVVSTLYSLVLKRIALVDVLALTTIYCLRIIAGGIATGLIVSSWLLAMCMFFFLSLALLKRYAELRNSNQGEQNHVAGRGYMQGDQEIIKIIGLVSGFLSVFLLALYINSDQARSLYVLPSLLWLAAPLLIFWITRLWLLTHRGVVNEDAVLFSSRDVVTYFVFGMLGVVIIFATVGVVEPFASALAAVATAT